MIVADRSESEALDRTQFARDLTCTTNKLFDEGTI
jgi:hypothetical protein